MSSPNYSRFFFLGTLLAIILPIYYVVEQNLARFYIFDQENLHDLSKRAIAQHGDNTREVVSYIVDELYEKHPNAINLQEEWMFNNAGNAMGAMYIIHASTCLSPAVSPTHYPLSCPIRPHHPLWTPHTPC